MKVRSRAMALLLFVFASFLQLNTNLFHSFVATINCREWMCDPTVCNVFSTISTKRNATSSFYKSSTINSRVNFDIYSIFVSYSKTNKQKQTNKQKSADNRISERKSGPFIYCFLSDDYRSRTDCCVDDDTIRNVWRRRPTTTVRAHKQTI